MKIYTSGHGEYTSQQHRSFTWSNNLPRIEAQPPTRDLTRNVYKNIYQWTQKARIWQEELAVRRAFCRPIPTPVNFDYWVIGTKTGFRALK